MVALEVRVAADIAAKCIAKGCWGGVYVPIDLCKRAWPTSRHSEVMEAIAYLYDRSLIVFHKGGSCIGLNPSMSAEVYAFALEHATDKRRAVLMMRGPPKAEAVMVRAMADRQVDEFEDDDIDLAAYVSRRELDMRISEVRDQVNNVAARDVEEVASLRRTVTDLQGQVHRLASDAGKWRDLEARITEHGKSLDSIRATWEEVDRLTDMMEDVLKADAARAKDRADEKKASMLTCPCGDRGAVMRPSWTAKGMRWFQDPDIAMCTRHAQHSIAFQFPEKGLVGLDRLVRRMPTFTGSPFIGVGDSSHAKVITAALLKAGRIDEGFVRGASIETGPGLDEEA